MRVEKSFVTFRDFPRFLLLNGLFSDSLLRVSSSRRTPPCDLYTVRFSRCATSDFTVLYSGTRYFSRASLPRILVTIVQENYGGELGR